jgi:hypothetical protein
MAKSNPNTTARKTVREYNALRAEILTWIQIEYSLIVASATITLLALAFFKEPEHWYFFSSALLAIIGTLIGLTSFARAMIHQASAYLIVFHDEPFEKRMLAHKKTKGIWLTTSLHRMSLFTLYIFLGFCAVGYPLVVAIKANLPVEDSRWFVGISLTVSGTIYVAFLVICATSYRIQPYIDNWERVKAKEPSP